MSQDPFGDIPLFRELQKLLTAGSGPVNLEIARQVATSVATGGAFDPGVDRTLETTLSTRVREAELLLSGYSRLPLDEPNRSHAFTRATWVTATLDAWNWLFEALAGRFASGLQGAVEGPGEGSAGPTGTVMGQVVPLLMGLQVGTLLGHLAQEVLYRHDLPIPREDDGKLFVVSPNLERVASDYGFEVSDMVGWTALCDVAHQLVLSSRPWVGRFHRSLLNDLIDSIEIDIGDLERRLVELQTQGLEGLEQGDSRNALPVVETDRYRGALDRLRAFLAISAGYATHCSKQVGDEMLRDAERVEEAMTRHAASPTEGKAALSSILGIDLDRATHAQGVTFCAAVVGLKGLPSLNKVWDAPDNLPSIAEIKDPFQWIERVIDPGGEG